MRIFLFLTMLLLGTSPAWATRNILVFGDSLSAGYGIRPETSWPALLEKRLAEKRLDYSVANASISGETTAGGKNRIGPALRQHQPAVVVVELGANDGLRGLPVAQMKENLNTIIEMARSAGARVLLVGMRLPPNYGPYAGQFHAAYAEVARKQKVPLVEFLLAGVAEHPRLFQPDMLHPTAEAQPRLLDNVWPNLAPLLK